jgi:cytoskeleton protein RodZ
MDVGATLRHARTRKGLTLSQLSRTTKINVGQLEALEMNDFDRLPASIYTRGFLRAYAREVDLDPEEIVDEYLGREVQSLPMQLATSERAQAPRMIAPPRDAVGAYHLPEFLMRRLATPIAATVIAAVLLASYLAWASRQGGEDVVANAQTQSEPPPSAASPTTTTDATHAANVSADALHIDMKVNGPCWLSANADGAPIMAKLLQRGEDQRFEAKDEIVMRVGDPSTVAMAINGVTARSLGSPQVAVTVQINKHNYRDFLVP